MYDAVGKAVFHVHVEIRRVMVLESQASTTASASTTPYYASTTPDLAGGFVCPPSQFVQCNVKVGTTAREDNIKKMGAFTPGHKIRFIQKFNRIYIEPRDNF